MESERLVELMERVEAKGIGWEAVRRYNGKGRMARHYRSKVWRAHWAMYQVWP